MTDPSSHFAPNLCEALIPAEVPHEVALGARRRGDGQRPRTNKTYYHALYNWKGNCPSSLQVSASRARYVDAESDVGYFDVTSRWLVSPEMNDTFGFPLPTCFIYNLFTGSDACRCNRRSRRSARRSAG